MVWDRTLGKKWMLGSQGQPEYKRASVGAGSHADGGGRHTGAEDDHTSLGLGTASGTLILPEMKTPGHPEFTESAEKHASPSGSATLEGVCLPISLKTHFICIRRPDEQTRNFPFTLR